MTETVDIPFPLPLPSRGAYLKSAARRRLERVATEFVNPLRRPKVLIAGEYFTGNLGDWVMGQVLLATSRRLGVNAGITSYQARWRGGARVIMGGGEIADAPHFSDALRISGAPERVVVCGMNPVYDLDSAPADLLERLERIRHFCIRSRSGAERLRKLLRRDDVEYRPDLAFSLYDAFRRRGAGIEPRRKRLGISLLAFYVSVQRRKCFAPDPSFHLMVADPRFRKWIPIAGERYLAMMRALVRLALEQGWEVVNIPFAEADAMLAEAGLGDLDVIRRPYSKDTTSVLTELRECERYVAARFHSHVFGLVAGTRVISVDYAGKTGGLWCDIGLDPAHQVTRLEICEKPEASAERLLASEGVSLSPERLLALARASEEGAENCVRAALLN